MNVIITSELQDFIRQKLQAGKFQSADEVVCEGLRLLQRQEEVRRKIDEGWEQAKSGQLLEPDEMRAQLNERKAAWKRERGLA